MVKMPAALRVRFLRPASSVARPCSLLGVHVARLSMAFGAAAGKSPQRHRGVKREQANGGLGQPSDDEVCRNRGPRESCKTFECNPR